MSQGLFTVHCPGALSNHHLAHRTTHGTIHHSLHESLAQCGCVSFDMFENMGPGLLKSLNKARERERGKHNYLREEKIKSIKLTHNKAQQRDGRLQYRADYEKLQKEYQRGEKSRHNVKREGEIIQKKILELHPTHHHSSSKKGVNSAYFLRGRRALISDAAHLII